MQILTVADNKREKHSLASVPKVTRRPLAHGRGSHPALKVKPWRKSRSCRQEASYGANATGLIYAVLDVYHNIVSSRKVEQKITPVLDAVQDSCISSFAGDSWMVITLANKSVQPVQKGANRINKPFIFTSERGANWNVNKQLSSVPAARDWSPNQTSRPFRWGKWVIFAGPL